MFMKNTHMTRHQQQELKIAVIGDIHTYWDQTDIWQFANSDYDLLFFTGDLGDAISGSSLKIAKLIAQLRMPVLLMPGNNDTFDIAELVTEFSVQNGMAMLADMEDSADLSHEPLLLAGYSNHRITTNCLDLTLIAARPHSMGGQQLSFADRLSSAYGVEDMAMSVEKLKQLIDSCETTDIIFLGHNGPAGLGMEPADMWGCDFKQDGGDWGDPDMAVAIDYAQRQGKRVLAVVAGHMHLRTKCGRTRPWQCQIDNTLYVNAAKVPRIFVEDDCTYRHHIEIRISGDGMVQSTEKHIAES